MVALGREAILAAGKLRSEAVEIPEWGGSVIVREMTGTDRDRFESSIISMKGAKPELRMQGARALVAALCVVDDAGERIFGDADLAALGGLSGAALTRVFEVASRLSGMTAETMEELVEGFPLAASGEIGSGSP